MEVREPRVIVPSPPPHIAGGKGREGKGRKRRSGKGENGGGNCKVVLGVMWLPCDSTRGDLFG